MFAFFNYAHDFDWHKHIFARISQILLTFDAMTVLLSEPEFQESLKNSLREQLHEREFHVCLKDLFLFTFWYMFCSPTKYTHIEFVSENLINICKNQ